MFHMPVFIFISGFLAKDLTQRVTKGFEPFLLLVYGISYKLLVLFVTLPLDSPEAFSFLNPGGLFLRSLCGSCYYLILSR